MPTTSIVRGVNADIEDDDAHMLVDYTTAIRVAVEQSHHRLGATVVRGGAIVVHGI